VRELLVRFKKGEDVVPDPLELLARKRADQVPARRKAKPLSPWLRAGPSCAGRPVFGLHVELDSVESGG